MAAETFTFTPSKFLASDDPDYTTKPCTVVSGQNLAAGTVIESDAAGKMLTSGGVNKPAGVLLFAVNATGGDKAGIIIKFADIFADQLIFHATQSTNLLKAKLLEGTGIVLTFQDTGEV